MYNLLHLSSTQKALDTSMPRQMFKNSYSYTSSKILITLSSLNSAYEYFRNSPFFLTKAVIPFSAIVMPAMSLPWV